MKSTWVGVVLGLVVALNAADSSAADPLRAWQGTWEGQCRFARPVAGERSVGMRLEVGVPDALGARAWRIVYVRQRREEIRDYQLRATASKDRYVLDERNGILISVFHLGAPLVSEFEVGDVRVSTLEEILRDGTLRIRMTTSRPDRFTDSGGGSTPAVRSYWVEQVQDCSLSKG